MKALILLFSLLFSSVAWPNGLRPTFQQYAAAGLIPGWTNSRAYGDNLDVDTATVPEDVWPVGGAYPFPSAAATTTIASGSGDDASGGTGCTAVRLEGLDSDWEATAETIVMTGATTATFDTAFFRVNRATCVASGSGEVNAGDIDIKHGATTIKRIEAGAGISHAMIYSVPAGKTWLVDNVTVSILKKSTGFAVVNADIKPLVTGTWQTILILGPGASGSSQTDFSPPTNRPFAVPEKTDVRFRVTEVSANDTVINGNVAGFLINNTYDEF